MRKYIIILLLFIKYMGGNCLTASAQTVNTDSIAICTFPSIPFLPNPLVLDEAGKNIPIATNIQWQQKREWIKKQYQYWVSGLVPPPPKTIHIKIISEVNEKGVKLRTVELYFGPDDKAKMTVELMIPSSDKRLPVFMTQWNHRGWAQIAVRRGYIGCIYAGADGKDDTRNYSDIYSDYDFATLMKRAWGASRVVDYLVKLPEVDTACIALTGHSRNGKQSLMAAAFDERIKAVVSSSGGTGAENTFRFSDERFNTESIEEITRNFPNWFVSRLRLFTGREQKLPVDQNLLMSLIAPRGLMLESAITEGQGNPWGVEQSYKSVEKVYHFLHADSDIAILLRNGRHQHAARDVEKFIDFFDYIFGRSQTPPDNKLYYDYSFERWKQLSGEQVDPLKFPMTDNRSSIRPSDAKYKDKQQDSVRKQIQWLLGDEPPSVQEKKQLSSIITKNSTYPNDYLEDVIEEQSLPKGIAKMKIGPYNALGDNLWGTIYFPSSTVVHDSVSQKLSLVIFLHEYAYATGYHRRNVSIIRNLTEQGFAVLEFDMVGFGTRIEEGLQFYDRYPHWSIMGKMVADTRSIINDACTRMSFIDSGNIYLAGYSLGGTVALLTAALDKRVKGTAVVSAFSSFRYDNTGTEGIRHYSHLHGLLPRLGFFEGHEDRIPIDFDEILTCIAPRSLLIIAPEQDRDHSIVSVRKIISAVSTDRGKVDWLTFQQPKTYSHFTESLQQNVAVWLFQKKIH